MFSYPATANLQAASAPRTPFPRALIQLIYFENKSPHLWANQICLLGCLCSCEAQVGPSLSVRNILEQTSGKKEGRLNVYLSR